MASAAVADDLPPLREVAEIDNGMLAVAIAVEISDNCPGLEARRFKGLTFLWNLKAKAGELGYTDDQVTTYVESDEEEARIRELGEAYVTSLGFDPKTEDGLCAAGVHEMQARTKAGSFLRSAN